MSGSVIDPRGSYRQPASAKGSRTSAEAMNNAGVDGSREPTATIRPSTFTNGL